MNPINFIEFDPSLAIHFKELNVQWLKQYFYVEPIDEEMLSNPQAFFIDKGGFIFFAAIGEEIAGTFALLKVTDAVYELSKMAVYEKFRGMKIGNQLLDFCLRKARTLGARKLVLYSSTRLENAIHLYRKYGFKEIPVGNTEYKRSDIKMELDLDVQPVPPKI
ncbi:MAG: GNAT family N-acetyltransferase [Chitinophagaceae bacterium]